MILFGLEAYIGRIDIMCTMKATGELQIYLLTSFYLFKRTKKLKDERKVCSYRLNDKTETSYTDKQILPTKFNYSFHDKKCLLCNILYLLK